MTMIPANQRRQFDEQGYLLARGILDVETDINSFRDAYVGYLDTLAKFFVVPSNPDLHAAYSAQSFPDRFATLLGCSGGSVLQHLDPSLSIFVPGYQRRKELPSAQRPELFQLMRNDRLLDAMKYFSRPRTLGFACLPFQPEARPSAVKTCRERGGCHRAECARFRQDLGLSCRYNGLAYGRRDRAGGFPWQSDHQCLDSDNLGHSRKWLLACRPGVTPIESQAGDHRLRA